MNFNDFMNISVVLLSLVGGYVVYVIKNKAKQLQEIVSRMHEFDKKQAIINVKIENMANNIIANSLKKRSKRTAKE